MEAHVLVTTWLTMMVGMSFLMCHPPQGWRGPAYPPELFQPGPQYCPDTGRTVCTAVDYYPTDRIYSLLTNSRSQVFNLTSLFVDERKGDTEPNTSQLITQPPYYQDRDAYGPNQPPPGGRFSPAGRTTGNQPGRPSQGDNWNQQNRWRQVSPSSTGPPTTGTYNNNNSGTARGAGGGGDRVDINDKPGDDGNYSPRNQNPGVQQRTDSWRPTSINFNNNGNRQRPGIHPRKPDTRTHTPPPFVEQRRVSDDQFGQNPNWGYRDGSFFDGQNKEQFHHQTQPHRNINNNKGHTNYRRVEQRNDPGVPHTRKIPSNVQFPPFRQEEYSDDDSLRATESKIRSSVKRDKRNQDVEVACPVQSTYVPPRAALNDQSQWKYIVNVPERDQRFSQVVRVDVCTTEGQPCTSRISLPFGFESRCRQKYIKKKLLSLNPDGQGTSEDNFFIPSCCVCEIVRPTEK